MVNFIPVILTTIFCAGSKDHGGVLKWFLSDNLKFTHQLGNFQVHKGASLPVEKSYTIPFKSYIFHRFAAPLQYAATTPGYLKHKSHKTGVIPNCKIPCYLKKACEPVLGILKLPTEQRAG